MPYCTTCGKQFEGKFCPECGTPVSNANQEIPTANSSESSTPSTAPRKKRHGCLSTVLALFVIFSAIGIAVSVGASQSGSKASSTSKSILAETMDLTEDQEKNVLTVFDACGIVEIKDVTQVQVGEDQTSYYVNDDETEHYRGIDSTIVVWINNNSKEVNSIYFNDHDIYIDGEVIAPVSDYYVSSAQRDQYRVDVQLLVEEVLNYPNTAEFGSKSEWSFGVQDGYDIIQSSVTAQNAFGVESTETFQVKVDRSTSTVVSFILGDTEYIKQ